MKRAVLSGSLDEVLWEQIAMTVARAGYVPLRVFPDEPLSSADIVLSYPGPLTQAMVEMAIRRARRRGGFSAQVLILTDGVGPSQAYNVPVVSISAPAISEVLARLSP